MNRIVFQPALSRCRYSIDRRPSGAFEREWHRPEHPCQKCSAWKPGRWTPDFKTIVDFRRDHGDAIRSACHEFVVLCRRLKLFSDGIVAIDGSKFKAVNNRNKNFTGRKLQARMQQLEENVARYMRELDRADRDESTVLPEQVRHFEEQIAKVKEQMRSLQEIGEQMQASPDGQVSLTNPDARSMATSGRSTGMVGNNVQSVVDTRHHHIVAHEVTNVGHDRSQLANTAVKANKETGADRLIALADRGYYDGDKICNAELALWRPWFQSH